MGTPSTEELLRTISCIDDDAQGEVARLLATGAARGTVFIARVSTLRVRRLALVAPPLPAPC